MTTGGVVRATYSLAALGPRAVCRERTVFPSCRRRPPLGRRVARTRRDNGNAVMALRGYNCVTLSTVADGHVCVKTGARVPGTQTEQIYYKRNYHLTEVFFFLSRVKNERGKTLWFFCSSRNSFLLYTIFRSAMTLLVITATNDASEQNYIFENTISLNDHVINHADIRRV